MKIKVRIWRAFAVAIVAAFAILMIFAYVQSDSSADGIPGLLRKSFLWNEKVGLKTYSNEKTPRGHFTIPVGKAPRVNGSIGLESELYINDYEIEVENSGRVQGIKVKDLYALPKTSIAFDFKCIEGWSQAMGFAGLKFSEFMQHYNVGTKPDGTYYKYVGLETPDGEYYVSIDMQSMLNPQTLLAYEMNSQPLRVQNGAPLRLVIPVKYGIKNLKRIGSIWFSDERPPDYWAERGYDWYAGL